MSLDHINVKNAITNFRSIHSIVASVRSWLVIIVEETVYEKPPSFDEVATNTKHLPNFILDIRRVESRSRGFLSAVCVVTYTYFGC